MKGTMRSRSLHIAPPHGQWRKSGATFHTAKTEEGSFGASFSSFASDGESFAVQKQVGFADEQGGSLCKVHFVENFRASCPPDILWWERDELQVIKAEASQVMRKFRSNSALCEAVMTVLAQGMTGTEERSQIKVYLDRMKECADARGLEQHIVMPCRKLTIVHYKSVFEMQDKVRRKRMTNTDKGLEAISAASEKSSRPFTILASRKAQHDTREAMRAAFCLSSKPKEVATNMQKGKQQRSKRLQMNRRAMFSHSVSVRNVNSKYGSISFCD
jgi:hypothetical protein